MTTAPKWHVTVEIEVGTDVGDLGWLLATAGRKIGDELKRTKQGKTFEKDVEIKLEGGKVALTAKWRAT